MNWDTPTGNVGNAHKRMWEAPDNFSVTVQEVKISPTTKGGISAPRPGSIQINNGNPATAVANAADLSTAAAGARLARAI